ncbi:acyl carrier protein [Bengtsoniella intestinalis]|uniref:acyl carrier protein n=1 Tax=Bengtsoniella intestinalis TaxID=3073143 RepID=UPI00391F17B7
MSNEEILSTLQELVAEQFAVDVESITLKTSLADDLGADSVDFVELVMAIEEAFDVGEIQDEDFTGMKTIGDAVAFIAGKLN